MARQVGRRQLLKGAAASVAGAALGVGSIETAAAATPQQANLQPGTVSRVYGAGQVGIRLDRPPGRLTRALGSVLHRSLRQGDRVAVQAQPDGSLIASPIFVGLLGNIEKQANEHLTVQGRTCVIDDLSVVRNASGDHKVATSSDPNLLAVGRFVGLLCIDNRKSGGLTLHTAFLEV